MLGIKEKSSEEHFDDLLDGLKKTFIETPMDFGDFVARVSGFRDYQLNQQSVIDLENPNQKQAILELRAIWEALDYKNWDNIAKVLKEDFQERPAYYVGSMGLGVVTSWTISAEKLTNTLLLKATYGVSSIVARSDSATNEQFESIKDVLKMSDYEFNRYVENTINNIDTLKIDESSILGYIKEAGLKKQPTESEIKDEVDKRLRDYVHANGITSFQDIGEFMDKTREELINRTIKIENKEQNLKEERQKNTTEKLQEESKEENYSSQVYRR